MSRRSSPRMVLILVFLLVLAGLVGAWKWAAKRTDGVGGAQFGPRSAPTGAVATAADTSHPDESVPSLGSTQQQFAEMQKKIPEPEIIPLGMSVGDKLGMVRSPHAADQGYVDVTGLPPGAKARCPYTGKIFLVP